MMNKAFEKILEKLEELQNNLLSQTEGDINLQVGVINGVMHSKKIVQEVAEEYNNGWIPCSEKLPKLRQYVLVTVKYTGFMGMHGYWIKTGHMEAENDWFGDCVGGEVIAWQPLPEPFKERD